MLPARPRLKPWLPWTMLAIVGGVATLSGLMIAGKEVSTFGSSSLLRFAGGMALALSGAAAGIFALHRRLRLRAPGPGCRRCGYDLRGTPGDVCSECGALIAGSHWSRESPTRQA